MSDEADADQMDAIDREDACPGGCGSWNCCCDIIDENIMELITPKLRKLMRHSHDFGVEWQPVLDLDFVWVGEEIDDGE